MTVERGNSYISINDLQIGDVFLYKEHVCLRVDEKVYKSKLFDTYGVFYVDLETSKLNALNESLPTRVERIKAKVVCE